MTDQDNDRVEEFDSSGAFVRAIGSSGNGDGQLHTPYGVAVDGSGNVYVADYLNNRVEEFSSAGIFKQIIGSEGSGNGQFDTPAGVAFDSSGNLYVADQGNNRIQKFRVAAVPEPGLIASFLLAGAASVGLGIFRKRRK